MTRTVRRVAVLVLMAIVSTALIFAGGAQEGEAAAGTATAAGTAGLREAPMLTEMVQAGELPPLEERIPSEPKVVEVMDLGEYGGKWRQLHIGSSDQWQNSYLMIEYPGKWSPDFTEMVPDVARDWEFSNGGRTVTIFLREGMKWSDGAPFTTEDVRYWWEGVILNDDLTPGKPSQFKRAGALADLTIVDDTTFSFSWDEPYGLFTEHLASVTMWQPAHFMKEFHPDYTDMADIEAAMAESDYDNWSDFYSSKTDFFNNPGTPELMAWTVENTFDQPVQIATRNPYYYKVDQEGRQLPYIDRVERTLTPNAETLFLKAIAGDTDFQHRRVGSLQNFTTAKENERKGDYRVYYYLSPGTTYGSIFFNYHHSDEILRELFRQKDFRVAFSIAIDREEINDLVFKGLGSPGNPTAAIGSPWYEEEFRTMYAYYDPDEANQLLDGLGLTQRDSEGYRLRPDGKRLSVVNNVFTPWPPDNVQMMEMAKEDLAEVGIEMLVKPTDRALWVSAVHGLEHDIASYGTNLGFPASPPYQREGFAQSEGSAHWAPQWALWIQTDGAEGEEPPAPVKRIDEIYDELPGMLSQEDRIEAQKEMLRIHAENAYVLGILAEPSRGRFGVRRTHFKNVPDDVFDPNTIYTSAFWIDQ